MTTALARIRQVKDYLTKRMSKEEETWVLDQLPESAHALFRSMNPYDRYHCTAIARRFAALNPPQWALQAALLHDCGKPSSFGLLGRIFSVLSKRQLVPPSPPEPVSWRRSLQIYQWHGQYGSQFASRAGLADEVCNLIRHHHDLQNQDIPWLQAFQQIDDD